MAEPANIPTTASHERFIPLRYSTLARTLIEDCRRHTGDASVDAADEEKLWRVADLIHDVVRQEADGCRQVILEHYEGVNPDRDMLPWDRGSPSEAAQRLPADIAYLLDCAGFKPVDRATFDKAVVEWNVAGVELHVDLSQLDYVAMFRRGKGEAEFGTPILLGMWEKTVRVPVIRRLAVMLRRRGDDSVHIKMFKDVPNSDIESVLPGTSIRMRPSDKFWLTTTAATAAFSLLQLVFDFEHFNIHNVAASVMLWASLLGGYRIYYYYSVLRDQAAGRLNRQLYDRQLGGNAGLLGHILESVCRQEANQILTAYVITLRAARAPEDLAGLDKLCERWLHGRFDERLDFDVNTAVAGLRRLRLWNEGDKPSVPSPEEAAEKLKDHLIHRRSRDHHVKAAAAFQPPPPIIPAPGKMPRSDAEPELEV